MKLPKIHFILPKIHFTPPNYLKSSRWMSANSHVDNFEYLRSKLAYPRRDRKSDEESPLSQARGYTRCPIDI